MLYAALSDRGRIRDNNEDSYHADGRIFIVADGMGGHRAGEVASSSAITAFVRFEAKNRALPPLKRIHAGILAANDELHQMAQGDPGLEGMGTTFTCILVEEGLFLGHVGDSRAYLWSQGRLRCLTRDHSLVEKMVREGYITPIEARFHPQRNIILRALGVAEELQVDLDSPEAAAGDRILICSDGLSGPVDDRAMEIILASHAGLEECCRARVDAANDRGGQDNITVILTQVAGGDLGGGRGGGKGHISRWKSLFSRGGG